MSPGVLHLVPANLAEPFDADLQMSAEVRNLVRSLDYFIVENAKTARKFLKQVDMKRPLQGLHMAELSINTPAADLPALLAPILAGASACLLSEAGAPAVADPGAALIALAHSAGIRVRPMVGPSAILLALMASGLDGQRFAFHGYLPVDARERQRAIRELEQVSQSRRQTQLWIETPYRNDALLKDLLTVCKPGTHLAVACNLTADDEYVATRTVAAWRAVPLPDLQRRPCVFLILA